MGKSRAKAKVRRAPPSPAGSRRSSSGGSERARSEERRHAADLQLQRAREAAAAEAVANRERAERAEAELQALREAQRKAQAAAEREAEIRRQERSAADAAAAIMVWQKDASHSCGKHPRDPRSPHARARQSSPSEKKRRVSLSEAMSWRRAHGVPLAGELEVPTPRESEVLFNRYFAHSWSVHAYGATRSGEMRRLLLLHHMLATGFALEKEAAADAGVDTDYRSDTLAAVASLIAVMVQQLDLFERAPLGMDLGMKIHNLESSIVAAAKELGPDFGDRARQTLTVPGVRLSLGYQGRGVEHVLPMW
jgi:hypothetical protein